jgi:hypothetical protein
MWIARTRISRAHNLTEQTEFFLLFQRGGPLSAVPAILAGGAAIMAIAGILFFHEAPSWQRLVGVAFAICWVVFPAQIEINFAFTL